MSEISRMTTDKIYQKLRMMECDARRADHLVELFYRAGVALADKIENNGWKWRTNYMREYAGCALGASFTNTISPLINELVFRRHPDLKKYKDQQTTMFGFLEADNA